jgi:hypothetical protein
MSRGLAIQLSTTFRVRQSHGRSRAAGWASLDFRASHIDGTVQFVPRSRAWVDGRFSIGQGT